MRRRKGDEEEGINGEGNGRGEEEERRNRGGGGRREDRKVHTTLQ